jgi:methionine synthase II (cobalamin-independent)
MKRSTNRILTTHVGSLPRPDDLRAMILQKQRGETIDEAALVARVRSAVAETVRRARRRPASTSSPTARWAASASFPMSTSA